MSTLSHKVIKLVPHQASELCKNGWSFFFQGLSVWTLAWVRLESKMSGLRWRTRVHIRKGNQAALEKQKSMLKSDAHRGLHLTLKLKERLAFKIVDIFRKPWLSTGFFQEDMRLWVCVCVCDQLLTVCTEHLIALPQVHDHLVMRTVCAVNLTCNCSQDVRVSWIKLILFF